MNDTNMSTVKESIIIDRPPSEVFKFWRQLENLPLFMEHLQKVEKIDNYVYHWKTKAPLGTSVEWDAVITDEKTNKYICWQSTKDSEIENSGAVWFTEWQGIHGDFTSTHVEVEINYKPPFGKVGEVVASIFGENPQQQVRDDLQRLKQVFEKNGSVRHAI